MYICIYTLLHPEQTHACTRTLVRARVTHPLRLAELSVLLLLHVNRWTRRRDEATAAAKAKVKQAKDARLSMFYEAQAEREESEIERRSVTLVLLSTALWSDNALALR